MTEPAIRYTAFAGDHLVASGLPEDVALAVKALAAPMSAVVLDDATGRVVDLDLRGTVHEVRSRYSPRTASDEARGRGRPKLGVVAREVTLLPRHWDWLASQPGGASVALRKLVEEARRDPATAARAARDVAYRALVVLGGDRKGFEEAMRGLYADDRTAFERHIADWPVDIRDHAVRLAFPQG